MAIQILDGAAAPAPAALDGIAWIFGCTDLRISASKAKFDERADGDVRLVVHRPKPRKNCAKKVFRSENFAKILISSKDKISGIVRNAFSQIFEPIQAKFET